jgi:hypothetical protein
MVAVGPRAATSETEFFPHYYIWEKIGSGTADPLPPKIQPPRRRFYYIKITKERSL